MMIAKLAMVIDSSVCIDCKGCMAACKVENSVPSGYWRNWIKQEEADFESSQKEGYVAAMHFQPGNCMHCDNPTCVQACPTGATYKDTSDGVVKVNEQLCIGCGSCIPACPYDARYRHPEKKTVDKCDFCEQRRARGDLPACVTTCPTKARVFGDLNDRNSDVSRLIRQNKAVHLLPEQDSSHKLARESADTDTDPDVEQNCQPRPVGACRSECTRCPRDAGQAIDHTGGRKARRKPEGKK